MGGLQATTCLRHYLREQFKGKGSGSLTIQPTRDSDLEYESLSWQAPGWKEREGIM